jgi:hypothetical protein
VPSLRRGLNSDRTGRAIGKLCSLRESRLTLSFALILLLRLGLPVTAFFVALNPIWGFSWYFNTESWATGIYQKLTELRVDNWRANMSMRGTCLRRRR